MDPAGADATEAAGDHGDPGRRAGQEPAPARSEMTPQRVRASEFTH
jgi:hypothetical protein